MFIERSMAPSSRNSRLFTTPIKAVGEARTVLGGKKLLEAL